MENPKPATKRCTQEILKQMDSIFYEIGENIGFFCKIKFQNENIPVLIVNNCMTNEFIKSNNISINNEKFEVDNFIYKNKELNISIINLKNYNNKINSIELDDKLYENDFEIFYDKESIYIVFILPISKILVRSKWLA